MTLVVCAAIYGILAAWVFRRFTNAARMRATVNRILAHVMEFALFIDEPGLILKAQLELIGDNVRLLKQIALPCVLMAIPFALIYPVLERSFGDRASNVLTLPMGKPLPAGVVVETPGVRIFRTHEVSWRIRTEPKPKPALFGLPWLVWFGVISAAAAAFQGLAARARAA